NTAISAARTGAAVLQAHSLRRSDLVIDKKARNDLVSQADRDAEAAIIEQLQENTAQFGIVAEETGGQASGAATWYIDPLDGTTHWLHGSPHDAAEGARGAREGACVQGQAPREAATPVLGVVYHPSCEELFTAMYGVGAWLNGHRLGC